MNIRTLYRSVFFCTVLVLSASLSGCFESTFQLKVWNSGDYPLVGLFVEQDNLTADSLNLLSAALPAGATIILDATFISGPVYEAVGVCDVEGTLVDVRPLRIDTSALSEAYVSYWIAISSDGGNGSGYNYGLQ